MSAARDTETEVSEPLPPEDARDEPGSWERTLVLSSLVELLRCHRELLESQRRVEHAVATISARLEALEAAPGTARSETGEPDRSGDADAPPGPAEPPPSEESLLRGIQGAVRENLPTTSE